MLSKPENTMSKEPINQDFVLTKFDIRNFGIVDESKPILLFLNDKGNENKRIILGEGEQEVGKSNFLEVIKGLMGGNLALKEENYINRTTGKIGADAWFEYGGREFNVSWRKSYFKLRENKKDELLGREGYVDLQGPAELLKKIVGYVADTPMGLKKMDGAKQVEEFKKVLGSNAELQKEEDELSAKLTKLTNARTDANREYVGIKKRLDTTPMYINWQESEAKYKEEKNLEAEKKKFVDAQSKAQQHENAIAKVADFKNKLEVKESDIANYAKQIEEIKLKIALLETEKADIETSIKTGEKFIKDTKSAKDDFRVINDEYLELAQYNAEYKQWQQVKQDKSDMDSFETLVIDADSKKDEVKQQLRELYKKHLPDIEGLEIIAVGGIDGEKETGVYYKDQPISILSESALWKLYLTIWHELNVKVVFIDNVSSLGTAATETINQLAKEGVYIFCCQMKKKAEFSLTIKDEL